MGKVHSIEQLQVSTPSYPGEWIPNGRTDYCQLVRNKDTGTIAEEYIVPADSRIPLMRTFQIYEHRRRQNDYLVEVYQVERQPSSYICQGGDYLRVKTERIPTRLSDILYMDQDRGLLVLEQALIGYKSIFNFQGPVLINDDMIGFNKGGKVKVWLNNNFAKNTPDGELNPPRYEQNTYHASGITNEAGMVSQVVDVIQQHIYPHQIKDFMNLFYASSPRSFIEALQLIKQYSSARSVGVYRQSNQQIVSIPTLQSVAIEQPIISHTVVPQHYTQQSQNFIIQNSSAPSITRSLQAPTQPIIIQNFAPQQPIITYQNQYPVTYYVQQPIIQQPYVGSNRVESFIQQPQLQKVVYPQSNIVTPRSTIIQKQQSIISQQPQVIQRQTIQNIPHVQHQLPLKTIVQPIQQTQNIIVQPNYALKSLPNQIVHYEAPVITSNSQIVPGTFRSNENVHAYSQVVSQPNQIVNPISQIVVPQTHINLSRVNHRFSHPSPRHAQNQIRVSSRPMQSNITERVASPFVSQQKVSNKKSTIISQNQKRGPSPTIFRPNNSPTRNNIIPASHELRKTQPISRGKSIGVSSVLPTKNVTVDIIHPNSQINKISPNRKQYRKSQIKQHFPTHNIQKIFQGVRKTNSINDPVLTGISPTLVTAQNRRNIQEIQVENVQAIPSVRNNIQVQQIQQKQQFVPFRGLPHKRNTPHQLFNSSIQVNNSAIAQPKIQIVNQVQSKSQIKQQKVTIATQQALFDKLQRDVQNTIADFTNPQGQAIQQQQVFSSFGQNQIKRPTQPKPHVQPRAHPQQHLNIILPQQPQQVFASFNYQPFRKFHPGHIQQKSIFQPGDNIISNISGIRGQGITGASGVSTFTNPLQHRAQVNEVVITQVRSLASHDSVNPEVRKLMMLPKNPNQLQQIPIPVSNVVQQRIQNEVVVEGIIQNIPIAQSHQIQHITQVTTTTTTVNVENNLNVVNNQQQQIIYEETIQRVQVTYGNNQQPIQHPRVDLLVTKNDLWTSNDSVPNGQQQIVYDQRPIQSISQTLTVNQTIKQNPQIVSQHRQVRQKLDIESLMRKHNQQSKNLFEKYEQYGRNIQRQLSPNTPTSPSSLSRQPQIRYGGAAIIEPQPRHNVNLIVQQPIQYQNIQTIQFYNPHNEQIVYQQRIEQVHRHQTNNQYQITNTYQTHNQYQTTNTYQYNQQAPAGDLYIHKTETYQSDSPNSPPNTPIINHQPLIIHHERIDHQLISDIPNNYLQSQQQSHQTYEINTYQYEQNNYENKRGNNDTPNSRQSRGYEYVTAEQIDNAPSYGIQNRTNYYRRQEQLGDTISFKQTTQSYVYDDIDNNIQQIRGSAPTYEQLRAALLQTNLGLDRNVQTYEEYTAEYHYQTTAYDDRS